MIAASLSIAMVSISSLEITGSSSVFTLNCTSTGSPATAVTWTKDGVVVVESTTYLMRQILHSGTTATYFNLLEVNAGPYFVTGDYSCEVSNLLGSTRRNVTLEGKFS